MIEEYEEKPNAQLEKIQCEIEKYEKDASQFHKRGTKIIERYSAKREDGSESKQEFNVLWSNVQTLLPALFDRPPMPNVERRFNKNDIVGREASIVLERAVKYFIDTDAFSEKIRQAVLDRLLVGRGTVWVRYSPTFKTVFNSQAIDDEIEDMLAPENLQITDDVTEELENEEVVIDYVHWKDFGHSLAKTWQEVDRVWRRVEMNKHEAFERFGEEKFNSVPMTYTDRNGKVQEKSKIEIFEVWDKTERKVFWLTRDCKEMLDEQEDPLKLKDFFPCPKPIFATITNDSLFPTADYFIYIDQADEIDNLTRRIGVLMRAVRVAGFYNASTPKLEKLLSGDYENILIPVDDMNVINGGIEKSVSFIPLDQIILALRQMYEAREKAKQDLYEISGMSDIIRGASVASETATAQQIKGQYASMRLGEMQKDVARFCRDLVFMVSEIICNMFDQQVLKDVSSYDLMTKDDAQMVLMQGGQLDQSKPLFDDVYALLKNETARSFRISIETDSTIKADQEKEKASRSEFLNAVGSFLSSVNAVATPEMKPLLMEMLQFGVKGFKSGRELEGAFEEAQKKLDQPQQPMPNDNSAQQQAQIEMQSKQQDAQIKQQELQAQMQMKQIDLQMKQIEFQMKQIELQRAEIEARASIGNIIGGVNV